MPDSTKDVISKLFIEHSMHTNQALISDLVVLVEQAITEAKYSQRASLRAYQSTEKYKAYQKSYYRSEKGKAILRAYRSTEKVKAYQKAYYLKKKEVLEYGKT